MRTPPSTPQREPETRAQRERRKRGLGPPPRAQSHAAGQRDRAGFAPSGQAQRAAPRGVGAPRAERVTWHMYGVFGGTAGRSAKGCRPSTTVSITSAEEPASSCRADSWLPGRVCLSVPPVHVLPRRSVLCPPSHALRNQEASQGTTWGHLKTSPPSTGKLAILRHPGGQSGRGPQIHGRWVCSKKRRTFLCMETPRPLHTDAPPPRPDLTVRRNLLGEKRPNGRGLSQLWPVTDRILRQVFATSAQSAQL